LFHIEKKIYYHDTDAGGVVYYASYLRHLEEGRTEYCRSIGIDIAEYAKNGIIFPVVRLEVDYKSPARYGDTISIFTKPEKVGNASLAFSQEIRRGETIILQAKMIWACVDKNIKPTRIPEEIRAKISI
jgi:acyl-CoA thioester hydrolase